MLDEIMNGRRKHLGETGEYPSKVHLTKYQAALASEECHRMMYSWRDSVDKQFIHLLPPKHAPQSLKDGDYIYGMKVVITDSEGPHFSSDHENQTS